MPMDGWERLVALTSGQKSNQKRNTNIHKYFLIINLKKYYELENFELVTFFN